MKRILNLYESEIIKRKESRSGVALNPEDLTVEYKILFPRITLCIIHNSRTGAGYFGGTMRSKHDKDDKLVGRIIAFVRAINEIITQRLNEANILSA